MIAVITAMQNEAHALLRHAETDREYTRGHFRRRVE